MSSSFRAPAAPLLTAISIALAVPAAADGPFDGTGYGARDLLNICQEADNASRLLGQLAETECEQYISGFVDALLQAGATGTEAGICPPASNTADEIRWAFAKWVHASWSERTALSAAEAVHATLKENFPCN